MRYSLLLLLIIYSSVFFGQVGKKTETEPFIITKTVSLPGMKKEKVFKTAEKWLKKLDEVQLDRFNEEKGVYEAKSRLPYENDVILENVFLSPDAALRTRGFIYFTIRTIAEDEKLTVEFTEFNHEAFISRYGKINFGLIMKCEKVPLNKCYENTLWCNAVWENMKQKIITHVTKLWMTTKDKID